MPNGQELIRQYKERGQMRWPQMRWPQVPGGIEGQTPFIGEPGALPMPPLRQPPAPERPVPADWYQGRGREGIAPLPAPATPTGGGMGRPRTAEEAEASEAFRYQFGAGGGRNAPLEAPLYAMAMRSGALPMDPGLYHAAMTQAAKQYGGLGGGTPAEGRMNELWDLAMRAAKGETGGTYATQRGLLGAISELLGRGTAEQLVPSELATRRAGLGLTRAQTGLTMRQLAEPATLPSGEEQAAYQFAYPQMRWEEISRGAYPSLVSAETAAASRGPLAMLQQMVPFYQMYQTAETEEPFDKWLTNLFQIFGPAFQNITRLQQPPPR